MATEWQLCLSCNSTQTSNSFVPTDTSNLWQSRTLGDSQWNNAGNGSPQATTSDLLYVKVTDGGASASDLAGYLVASRGANGQGQPEVTPFKSGGTNGGPKSTVIPDQKPSASGVWTFGPYYVQQKGCFELTFAANLVSPTGTESSDSWEEDPEFDVVDNP